MTMCRHRSSYLRSWDGFSTSVMTHEYILVALLGNYQPGDTFAQWPLHVTLVPWFDPRDLSEFVAQLQNVAAKYGSIESTVGEQRIWGPNTVNVITRVPQLQRLHLELLSLVRAHGTLLINEQYTGSNYTPHITHQKGVSAKKGSGVVLDTIYLVEKQVHVREKTIKAKIILKGVQ